MPALLDHFQTHPSYLSALGVTFDADQVDVLAHDDGGCFAYIDWVPDPSYFVGDATLWDNHWPPFAFGYAQGNPGFIPCPGAAKALSTDDEEHHPYFGNLKMPWPDYLDHYFGEHWRAMPLLAGVPRHPFDTVPHVFVAFFDALPVTYYEYQMIIGLRDEALADAGFMAARAVFEAVRRDIADPVMAAVNHPSPWIRTQDWPSAYARFFPCGEHDLTSLEVPEFRFPKSLVDRYARLVRRSQTNWHLLLNHPDNPFGAAKLWLNEEVNPWF